MVVVCVLLGTIVTIRGGWETRAVDDLWLVGLSGLVGLTIGDTRRTLHVWLFGEMGEQGERHVRNDRAKIVGGGAGCRRAPERPCHADRRRMAHSGDHRTVAMWIVARPSDSQLGAYGATVFIPGTMTASLFITGQTHNDPLVDNAGPLVAGAVGDHTKASGARCLDRCRPVGARHVACQVASAGPNPPCGRRCQLPQRRRWRPPPWWRRRPGGRPPPSTFTVDLVEHA